MAPPLVLGDGPATDLSYSVRIARCISSPAGLPPRDYG